MNKKNCNQFYDMCQGMFINCELFMFTSLCKSS